MGPLSTFPVSKSKAGEIEGFAFLFRPSFNGSQLKDSKFVKLSLLFAGENRHASWSFS
jgi:hypothetical protein